MKITPDSSLFTALSQFPDPSQVRDAAQRRQAAQNGKVDDAGQRGRDARDAVRQEVLRRQQAAAKQKQAEQGNKAQFTQALASKQNAGGVAADQGPAQPGADAFRREVPNTETKPKFVRLGQFVDISV